MLGAPSKGGSCRGPSAQRRQGPRDKWERAVRPRAPRATSRAHRSRTHFGARRASWTPWRSSTCWKAGAESSKAGTRGAREFGRRQTPLLLGHPGCGWLGRRLELGPRGRGGVRQGEKTLTLKPRITSLPGEFCTTRPWPPRVGEGSVKPGVPPPAQHFAPGQTRCEPALRSPPGRGAGGSAPVSET